MTELVLADHAPMSYTPAIGTHILQNSLQQIQFKTLPDSYAHFIVVFIIYSKLLQWNDFHHLPSVDLIRSELLAGSFQKFKNQAIMWVREYSLQFIYRKYPANSSNCLIFPTVFLFLM